MKYSKVLQTEMYLYLQMVLIVWLQQIAKNIPEKNIILEKEVVSISSDNTVSTIDKSKYSAKIIVIATDKLNFEYLAYRKKRNVISSNFNKSKTLYFSIDDNRIEKSFIYI